MRAAWLLLAILLGSSPVAAQEKKKKATPKTQAAHTKATPEQIRRFNELEKKQHQPEKKS